MLNQYIDSRYYDIEDLDKVEKNSFKKAEYTCMHMNIRSLPDKINKLKVFLCNLQEIGATFDFILLCETFLNDRNADMYNLPGYTFVEKHRKDRKCGGVGIYVKNNLSYKIREDLSIFEEHSFETVFIEVIGNQHNTVVGEIYRVPGSDCNQSIRKYEEILNNIQDKKQVIIGTDQNH